MTAVSCRLCCAALCCCLLLCAVALGKFNEGVVSYDEEGEVELDLERVDYASLMEVRGWGA